jgi:hypothetical protein
MCTLWLQRHPNGSNVEKHSLRAFLLGAFDRDETVSCIPTYPAAIGIGDHAAASNFARDPKGDAKGLRDKRVPDPFGRKSPIDGEPCQAKQRQIVIRQPLTYFLGNASRGTLDIAIVKYPNTLRGAASSTATVTPMEAFSWLTHAYLFK